MATNRNDQSLKLSRRFDCSNFNINSMLLSFALTLSIMLTGGWRSGKDSNSNSQERRFGFLPWQIPQVRVKIVLKNCPVFFNNVYLCPVFQKKKKKEPL